MFRFVCRIAGAVFCLVLVGMTAKLMQQDIATIGVRSVAERLNKNEQIAPTLIASLASGPEFAAALLQCRAEILKAGLEIQLHNLDRVNRAVDDARWQDAMANAQAFVEHAERCNPGDGNLWLRDAMLVRAIAETPAAIVTRLELSANLIPNYMPVVLARIQFLSSTTPETQAAGTQVLEDDLRIMMFYFRPYKVVPFLNSLPAPVKARAMALLPLAPADQIELFQKMLPKT